MKKAKAKSKTTESKKADVKKISTKTVKASKLKTSKDFEKKNSKYSGFDHFWSVMVFQKQMKPTWKSAVFAHIKSLGCDSPDKYEEGLKNFLGE